MRVISFLLMAILGVGCANHKTTAVAIDGQRMPEVDRVINEAIERKNIPGAVLLIGNALRRNGTPPQEPEDPAAAHGEESSPAAGPSSGEA